MPNLHTVKNPAVPHHQFSIIEIPLEHSSASSDSSNQRLCSTVVFTTEKNSHVSGPSKFKYMLFRLNCILIFYPKLFTCTLKFKKPVWNENNVTAISDFWPPKVKEGSPNWDPSDAAITPQWLLRSWGNARSKVNKKTGLAPDSWGAYEGMNSLSQEACLFPYIEC